MDAPTPRKSNRVPISLAAWFSALSTSWRLIFDTMSNEDSDATGHRLDGGWRAGTPGAAVRLVVSRCCGLDPWPVVPRRAGFRVLPPAAGSAILHCAVWKGGTRQVARAAKGSGL